MSDEKAVHKEVLRIACNITGGKLPIPNDIMFLRSEIIVDYSEETISQVLSCFQFNGNPSHKDVIKPFLYKNNSTLAGYALWTLCWLGYANHYKTYILEAVEPGFAWDPKRDVAADALSGAGLHLKTNRDRDFAQLIMRWVTCDEDDDFYQFPPPGVSQAHWEGSAQTARTAAGTAMGAESIAMIEDDALVDSCVARFIAERQDG